MQDGGGGDRDTWYQMEGEGTGIHGTRWRGRGQGYMVPDGGGGDRDTWYQMEGEGTGIHGTRLGHIIETPFKLPLNMYSTTLRERERARHTMPFTM